jgi:hypothetical protein
MFENRMLRRIFGPKGEEVEGGWRRVHNGEPDNLFASPNIIKVITSRRMRWTGHMTRMEEMRNACSILVGGPDEKRTLGEPRHR